MSVKIIKTTVIVIIVACYLGVRYLVEGATGVYTGSVFHDEQIEKEGHHGESRFLKVMHLEFIWL